MACFVLLLSVFISAQDLFIARTGDFVYYKCIDKLLGIAFFNPELFRIRVLTKESNNVIIDVKHTSLEDGFRITASNIVYGDLDKESYNNLISEITEVFELRNQIDNFELGAKIAVEKPGVVSGENININFEYWIPCIQLKSIVTKTGYSVYSLIKVGKMESESDKSFYTYVEEKRIEKQINSLVSSGSLLNAKFKNVTYSIYDDWVQNSDMYGSVWYKLKKYTGQDAVLLIENVNLQSKKIDNPFFFIKYYLLLADKKVLPMSIILKNDIPIHLQYDTYNQETMFMTFHRNVIYLSDNNTLLSITLAVYKELYESNKLYFDTIWDSIKM